MLLVLVVPHCCGHSEMTWLCFLHESTPGELIATRSLKSSPAKLFSSSSAPASSAVWNSSILPARFCIWLHNGHGSPCPQLVWVALRSSPALQHPTTLWLYIGPTPIEVPPALLPRWVMRTRTSTGSILTLASSWFPGRHDTCRTSRSSWHWVCPRSPSCTHFLPALSFWTAFQARLHSTHQTKLLEGSISPFSGTCTATISVPILSITVKPIWGWKLQEISHLVLQAETLPKKINSMPPEGFQRYCQDWRLNPEILVLYQMCDRSMELSLIYLKKKMLMDEVENGY